MVADRIDNMARYFGLGDRLEQALTYLASQDFSSMETGRYDIDGHNVFALVQTYLTKPHPEGKWEAHRKYIDIQYLAEGEEQIGYADIQSLTVSQDYQVKDDVLLLQGSGSLVHCRAGTFVILWPDDAHMPGLAAAEPSRVRKVVIKVAI